MIIHIASNTGHSHFRKTLPSLKANYAQVKHLLVAALGSHTPFRFDFSKWVDLTVYPELRAFFDGSAREAMIYQGSLLSGVYPTAHGAGIFMGPGRGGSNSSFYCAANGKQGRPSGIMTISDPTVMAAAELAKKCLYKQGEPSGQDDSGTAYAHFNIYAGSLVLRTMVAPSATSGKISTNVFYNASRYPYEGPIHREALDGSDFQHWCFGAGRDNNALPGQTDVPYLYMGSNCGMIAKCVYSTKRGSDYDFTGYKGCPNTPSPRHVSRDNFTNFGTGESVFSFKTTADVPASSRELSRDATDAALDLMGGLYDLMWDRALYGRDTRPDNKRIPPAAYLNFLAEKVRALTNHAVSKRFSIMFKSIDDNDTVTDLECKELFCGIPGSDWDANGRRTRWDRDDEKIMTYSIMAQRGLQESAETAAEWMNTRIVLPFGYHRKDTAGSFAEMEKLIHRRGQKLINRYMRHAYAFCAMLCDYAAAQSAITNSMCRYGASAFEYVDDSTLQSYRVTRTLDVPLAVSAIVHDPTAPLVLRACDADQGEASSHDGYNRVYLGYEDHLSLSVGPEDIDKYGDTGEINIYGFFPVGKSEYSSVNEDSQLAVPGGFCIEKLADGAKMIPSSQATYNATRNDQTSSVGSYSDMLIPYSVGRNALIAYDAGHSVEVHTLTQVLCPVNEARSGFSTAKAPESEIHDATQLGCSTSIRTHYVTDVTSAQPSPIFDDFSASVSILGDDLDFAFSIAYGCSTIAKQTLTPDADPKTAMLTDGNYGGYTPQVFLLKKLAVGGKHDPVSESGDNGVPLFNTSGKFKIHLYH